jgi:hypothetical protein
MGTHVYDPNASHNVNAGPATRIPTRHYDTRIPGQPGEEGDAYSLPVQVLGAPDEAGDAKVPYYQVYSDYSKAAEDALGREDVPGPYRDRVKSYFESLAPKPK